MANNANIRITAEDRTRRAVQSAQRGLTELSSIAKTAGVSITAIGTAYAAMAKKQIESVSESKKWADQLGISTQSLLELSDAFEKNANVSAEQFKDTLQELNVRLGEAAATGGGPLVDAFKEIGLKVEDVRKLKTDQMLLKIADAFKDLDDKQRLAFLSEEIFAGEAAKMVDVLSKGSDAIRGMTSEYRDLAGVISEDQAEQLSESAKRFKELSTAVEALGRELTLLVSGPGSDAINWLTDFAKKIREGLNVGKFILVTKQIENLNEKLEENLRIIQKYEGRGSYFETWAKNARDRVAELTDEIDKLKKKQAESPLPVIGDIYESDGMDDHVKTWEAAQRETVKAELAAKKYAEQQEKARKEAANQVSPDIWKNDGMDSHVQLQEQTLIMEKAMYDARLEASTAAYEQLNANDELFGEKSKERAEEWRATWEGVTDSFSAGVGDAFASAIMDQESLGKGLQQVMRGVAKQVISTLIQIGIQRAIQAKFGMSQTVAQTALGVKSAAILTSAYAPAALAVNIATAGGAGLAAAASSGIAASAQIASMASAKAGGLMGQAHDGLDYVPRTGTYLLEKGERVVKKEDNQRGMMGNTYNFTIQAIDTQSGVDFLMQNEGAIASMVQSRYESRGMTGGPIR